MEPREVKIFASIFVVTILEFNFYSSYPWVASIFVATLQVLNFFFRAERSDARRAEGPEGGVKRSEIVNFPN